MLKVSDEAIAALRRDAEGFDGVIIAVLDELAALRKVAEAAKQLRDDEGGDWICQQRLFVALKEAGYA